MDIKFKIIKYKSDNYHQALKLREQVLRIPLGLEYSQKDLEQEKDYIHIACYDHQNNNIIATAMLVPENYKEKICRMKQVAVDTTIQNKGIGSKLLDFCEKTAAQLGFKKIYCHARNYAINFYKKNNYITMGNYFVEINIPHIKMVKDI